MVWLAVVLILIGAVFSWAYRFHLFSFYIYLLVQFEHRGRDYQLLGSLRENLVHERKKKIAGLEMILSSWERGEEIQPKYEYFEELLEQLKDLVRVERRNLMATTKDIWLWGKLWSMLLKIQRTSSDKREKSDVKTLRGVLARFTELTDQVVKSATRRFSFSLNDAVRESLKTVRVEKSQTSGISIEEELEDAGENVRFSYDNFKHWQRVLTNLVRNAVEAVEARKTEETGVVVPPLAGRGRGVRFQGWHVQQDQTVRTRLPDQGVCGTREIEGEESSSQQIKRITQMFRAEKSEKSFYQFNHANQL
jgi:signal transduction histidine kinase